MGDQEKSRVRVRRPWGSPPPPSAHLAPSSFSSLSALAFFSFIEHLNQPIKKAEGRGGDNPFLASLRALTRHSTLHASSSSTSSHGEGVGVVGVIGEGGDQVKRPNLEKMKNITKHLTAGAASTAVARTFVAPLERLKLEYIVRGARDNWAGVTCLIWKEEGFRGFWKGNTVNLLRMVPFKSINFLSYDVYCKLMLKKNGKEVSNTDRLAAGAASGATATLICLPLDTIRTRLIAPGGDSLGGVMGCFQHMVHKEGVLSLYKGLLPALLSMVPSGAVFYGVYDILKASYLKSPKAKKELLQRLEAKRKSCNLAGIDEEEDSGIQPELGPIRTLVYGAVAGACAETVTYPLEVIRRHLQLQETRTLGLLGTLQGIVRRDGVNALFAGVVPSTLQVSMINWIFFIFHLKDVQPVLAFLFILVKCGSHMFNLCQKYCYFIVNSLLYIVPRGRRIFYARQSTSAC